MKLVVVIPTLGRSEQVGRLLAYLEGQTRPPDTVVLSAPDATHIDLKATPSRFPVQLVFGRKGLAAQRNSALDETVGRFDIITFFDDDFVPADDYLEGVEAGFANHPDWAVVMGRVLRDGATGAGLTWEDAEAALADPRLARPTEPRVEEHIGAYGCNMSLRAALIGALRFDERLVLYGWQEDVDFTSQLRRAGRVVKLSTIRGVHLGIKIGRVSGKRFGYSQIVNPLYLIRKGTVPTTFGLRLIGKNVVANLVRSLWPEPWVDRRGRLAGNIIAIAHVLAGRVEPEHILNL